MSKRNLLDSDEEEAAPPVKAEAKAAVKKEKGAKVKQEDGDGGDDDFLSLKVNTDYAKKYKERKKKEELTRLKEALGSGSESSDSESEDENGELLNKKVEDEFYKIIPMIATKDKRIYDPNAKFFEEAENEDEEEGEGEAEEAKSKKKKEKKEKALHVSDYLRERLLTKGAEDAEKSDDEEGAPPKVKSFAEEEAELKAAFWKSVNEMEGGEGADDLLQRRKRSKDDAEKEEAEFSAWRAEQEKKVP